MRARCCGGSSCTTSTSTSTSATAGKRIADVWEPRIDDGWHTFNDPQATKAFFGAGRSDLAEWLLASVNAVAARAVGSHAQRDLIAQTLLAAAEQSGQRRLANSLLNERLALKPDSILDRAWMPRSRPSEFRRARSEIPNSLAGAATGRGDWVARGPPSFAGDGSRRA